MIFDLLDDPQRPFAERRARLEQLPLRLPLALTPLTDDPHQALRPDKDARSCTLDQL